MKQLGTMVKDKATDRKGMLTHLNVDMGGNINYHFQPNGLNPATGMPIDGFWIDTNRVVGGNDVDHQHIPLEILGTEVEDIASGFKGMAISLDLHINGCIHVNIKPKGVVKGTNESIKACEFDIRRCKGKAIKPLAKKELEVSIEKKPSPIAIKSLFKR